MVLLNDVQRTVVVPQIQYIAVCDATTSSPKLQECSETVDVGSKSMSGQCSCRGAWCRSFFPPFKTKKLSASLNFVLSVVFLFQKMNLFFFFQKIVEHFFLVYVDNNVFCVCSLFLKTLLRICNCLLKFLLPKTDFYKKAF